MTGTLPNTPTSRTRRRVVQTGLTFSPRTPQSAATETLECQDDFNEDRQTLEVLRNTPQRSPGHDKENGAKEGILTPGKEIYGFEKRKKKGGLLDLVAGREGSSLFSEGVKDGEDDVVEVEQPKTPTSRRRGTRRTSVDVASSVIPTSRRNSRLVETEKGKTPERGKGGKGMAITPTTRAGQLKRSLDEASATPQSVRNKRLRNTRRLATVVTEGDSSDEEEEEEEEEIEQEDEEDEEEEEDGATPPDEEVDDLTESAPYERYFADLHTTRSVTSNNTLSKLPPLKKEDFDAALAKAPSKHASEIAQLNRLHQSQFPQWQFELSAGLNLLFYGFGSKRILLNSFAKTILRDHPYLVVDGYHPSATINTVLSKIIDGVLQHKGTMGSIQDQVALITTYFTRPDRPVAQLYLVIHNIDGPNIRIEKAQSALAALASTHNIQLIASIDHINAPLLWDNVKSARFGWVWHDVTTFEGYREETSFENSLIITTGAERSGIRGVLSVLNSLNTNARRIFKLLAEHQIEVGSDGNDDGGLSYDALFTKASEQFFVTNEVNFRTQLTEFRDHKIIQWRKGADKTDMLGIPLDGATLKQILEMLKEKGV